jgi:apolipoprotein N-acyltransferase
MRRIHWRLWLLVAFSTLLQLLPFPIAGPVPYWRRIFCWFCLTPLFFAVIYGRDADGKLLRPTQTALLGYVSGVLWYAGNCYWIYQTMYLYGGLPKPISLGILFLFSLYLGLYVGLFGWLAGWLNRSLGQRATLIVIPFLWVAVELARARITSFPWDLLGYTQVDNGVLTRIVPWTGVMGLSLLIAAVNSLWLFKTRMRWIVPLIAFSLIVVFVVSGNFGTQVQPVNSAAILLQENLSVGAEGKTRAETKQQMLASFDALSKNPQQSATTEAPEIVLWPEAPASFIDSDPVLRQSMGTLAHDLHLPVVVDNVSIASQNASGRYNLYNSASFYSAQGAYLGHYDKMHLVPFGEYTPYKPLFFFAGSLLDDLPFVPGRTRTMLNANNKRYGVFICYESIFGDEIRRFAGDGAEVLVNLSDDGWYGDTSAPWEHLDMVRMRAIENDRWVLRATNTGVTAAIDPTGRITAQLQRHIRSSLKAGFSFESKLTFYTRFGDWLAWVCAAVVASALIFGFARGRLAKRAEVH